jgi:simple sugar transport system ATP-binding protein
MTPPSAPPPDPATAPTADAPPERADGDTMTRRVLLEARQLQKSFGHVRALRGADFTVLEGEIVALIGDNGAGKSTLVKTLSGVHRADSGEILLHGEPADFDSVLAARSAGIETVYQDLALAPDVSSVANFFMGREIVKPGLLGRMGFLDNDRMTARTAEEFARLGVAIQNLQAPVADLSGGQRQGIAVCRAATWARKVLFLDEPTAALGVVQTARVQDLIRRVRDSGTSVVLISHDMPQVLEIADRVEVLRLGRRVATFRAADATVEDLVGAMAGADVREGM